MKVDLNVDSKTDRNVVQPIELFKAGTSVETAVSTLISHAEKSQIKLDKAINAFVKNNKDSLVFSPGVKGKESTERKVINKYKGQIRQVKDIYRAAVVFNSMAIIKKIEKTIIAFLEKYKFKVIRTDNTFNSPRSTGYRDISYNISDLENGNLIGELQIQYCPIKKFSAILGHKLYKIEHSRLKNTIKNIAHSKLNELSSYGYNSVMKQKDPTCISNLKQLMKYKHAHAAKTLKKRNNNIKRGARTRKQRTKKRS